MSDPSRAGGPSGRTSRLLVSLVMASSTSVAQTSSSGTAAGFFVGDFGFETGAEGKLKVRAVEAGLIARCSVLFSALAGSKGGTASNQDTDVVLPLLRARSSLDL